MSTLWIEEDPVSWPTQSYQQGVQKVSMPEVWGVVPLSGE